MKKLIALIALMITLLSVTAMAEDLGVQIIGAPAAKQQQLTLEDMQLGETYVIDGYAKITPVECMFTDFYAQFNKNANYHATYGYGTPNANWVYGEHTDSDWGDDWHLTEAYWVNSGLNADYVWLMLDLTNLQKTSVSYDAGATVKVIYRDDYVYEGWIRQVNYDHLKINTTPYDIYRYSITSGYPKVVVLSTVNSEPIDMMYKGTYAFIAKLPNYIVRDTESPLQMVITLDGNELIYNIRK